MPGTKIPYNLSAKIMINNAKTKKIRKPTLVTVPAIAHAFFLPFCKDFVKTGIKADEKVPQTKTSNNKSGNLNAAKNKDRSLTSKKWAKTLCLTNPKTLEKTIITIIIVAAEKTEVCFEENAPLILLNIFLIILHIICYLIDTRIILDYTSKLSIGE